MRDLILNEYPDVKVHLHTIDITNLDALKEMFNTLPEEFKKIDILLNNVGTGLGLGACDKYKIEDVYKMIDINVKALMGVTRLVTP